MGFIDVVGKINQVISIAKPIIDSVSSKIQPAMKQFAEKLLVYSEKYSEIKDFAVVIDKSANILGDILFVLGIKTEASDVIGFKISQTEKTVFDFEKAEDYMNFINNEVELDKEKYGRLSTEEKIVYSILEIALKMEVIGEKIGITLNSDMLMLITKVISDGKTALDASGIIDILKMIKENGKISISDVYDYLVGAGESDRVNTGEILHEIVEIMHPNKSKNIVNEFKEEARK